MFVIDASATENPGSDAILVAGMADADAQAMKFAVTKMGDDIAQTILPSMSAIELEAHRAGRQIKIIVNHEHLFRRNLVITQCRCHRDPALVHERDRFLQPDLIAIDHALGRFSMKLRLDAETQGFTLRQRIDEPEPGVVPGSEMIGPGISEADDQSQAVHRNALGSSKTNNLLVALAFLGRLGTFLALARFGRLDLSTSELGADDGDVVFLAELELGNLGTLRQLQR